MSLALLDEVSSPVNGATQDATGTRHAAVFLDRDGTLIEDRGHLRSPDEAVFFPDTVPALRALQARFLLFVVTHQPGVGLGVIAREDVARVNEGVFGRLREAGIAIVAVYCCPHRRDEGCLCIKPRPFFLHQAARGHGLDLRRSFVVGDHPHDVALAANAGASGIYVLTGHGAKHRGELDPAVPVVSGIREAAERILAFGGPADSPGPPPAADPAADGRPVTVFGPPVDPPA